MRTLALAFMLAALPAGAAIAQPANDACSSAQFFPIVGTSPANITGSNVGATPDVANSGCLGGPDDDLSDVWFRIVAPVTGVYGFDLYYSDFDTTISVWANDCAIVASSTPIACNDDDPDFPVYTSYVEAALTAGQSYLIRVSGYGGDSGNIDLDLYFPGGAALSGACCTGTVCSSGSVGACSGVFRGSGTTCSPDPCQPAAAGVCCRGATCATGVAQNACTASGQAGSVFVSAAAGCNPAGNATQPCCKADYNKANGADLLDIFAFLEDWFGLVSWADFDGQSGVDLLDIFSFLTAWFAGCS